MFEWNSINLSKIYSQKLRGALELDFLLTLCHFTMGNKRSECRTLALFKNSLHKSNYKTFLYLPKISKLTKNKPHLDCDKI
jgi:hypothetical protein